ncbi:MAG: hypothetical protein QXT28_13190 [Thermofilaceae archaeon]
MRVVIQRGGGGYILVTDVGSFTVNRVYLDGEEIPRDINVMVAEAVRFEVDRGREGDRAYIYTTLYAAASQARALSYVRV